MTYPVITNFGFNTNFDYVNRKITYSLTSIDPSMTGFGNGVSFRLLDEHGTIINQTSLVQPEVLKSTAVTVTSSHDFGIDLSSQYRMDGGYDTSIYRTDMSGVNVGIAFTNWEMSAETNAFSSAIRSVELGYTGFYTLFLDHRNNMYLDTPLVITRGDAVVQGAISTVTGRNQITLATSRVVASYTGYNMTNCIAQVISGAASGQTFTISSHTPGQSTLYADIDCYGLSGQIVKLMPYRIINSYSGLKYNNPSAANNKGSGGINARFGLESNIPIKVGSLAYTTGFYSGLTSTAEHPYGIGVLPGIWTGAVVALFADTYKRDVSMGDLIFYNPASSPGSTNTGVIIGVAAHGNASQGDYSVTYWPGVAAAAASTYTIYRSNTPVIQCFPEPDREYIAIAEINNGNLSGMSIQRVRTPKMEIDFTANEYENLFTLGNPVSHLHIGPVSVSNGGILDDSLTLTGNVIPYMYLSGVLYNGNPSSPTILLNKASFSTQNTSAAINFNGSYYKDGIFTYAVSTLFNASETMVCKLVLRYGSIKLAKTITIPVQPAV